MGACDGVGVVEDDGGGYAGGGGGAGSLIYKHFSPNISQTYQVKVGVGGKGTDTPITNDTYWGTDGESGTSTELKSLGYNNNNTVLSN